MGSNRRIATYNCQWIKNCEPYIKDILGQMHIMAFQEIWLCGDELHSPDDVHDKFVPFSESAVDNTYVLRRERDHNRT